MTKDTSSLSSSKRLGTLLLEGDLVTEGQLREGLAAQREQGGFLGRVLVDLGFLKEHDLVNLLVKQCKIPHISLTEYEIKRELFDLVSKETCIEHGILPVDKMGSILTVAMTDPLDTDALAAVRAACPDVRIKPILCTWRHYEQVMKRLFPETVEKPVAAETTLDDFGLSAAPKRKRPETAPQAQPEPAEEMVTAEGVEAVEEAEAPEDFDAFLQLEIKKAISGAVDRIAGAIRDRIRNEGPGKKISAPLFSQTVRWAFKDATEEAVGNLLYVTQTAVDRARKQGTELSGEELTELLRDAFRLGFEDALAQLTRNAFGETPPRE